jgi:hypothetical protein
MVMPEPQPPAITKREAPIVVFMHALCPEDTEPACGGGLWVGFRQSKVLGPADSAFGVAIDTKIGGSFGFGWEVGTNIPEGERDGMAFATAMAEGGVGLGFKSEAFELVPVLGIGGEAVAWGTSDRDDDPYAESYWYGLLGGRVETDDYSMFASFARKFKDRAVLDRVYSHRFEGGFIWDVKNEKEKKKNEAFSLGVWIENYDTHLTAGLVIGTKPAKKN